MSTRKIMMEHVRLKLGADPTLEQFMEYLVMEGVVKEKSIRSYVIQKEFFKRMRDPKAKSARDIEMDLAAEYDLSPVGVKWLRGKAVKKR